VQNSYNLVILMCRGGTAARIIIITCYTTITQVVLSRIYVGWYPIGCYRYQ